MAGVKLSHVYKEYEKGVCAVSDFSIETSEEEFIVLVGPSGCGKSTTLRMIAGLEDITGGEIFIDGRLVNNVEPKNRDIAMVFQNYALYPHMTVFDNIALSLQIRHFPKDIIKKRVEEVAQTLDITPYLKKKPRALSGGQRQRVALGRAIIREPKVFLLDEPLSNLDAKLRTQMRAEIIKLYRKLHTTFIYVTHDQTEAMTMATKIVVMNNGFIQQVDAPHAIYHRPANVFVASFMGSPQMNFFENARLSRVSGKYYAELIGKKFLLPEDKQSILAQKDQQPCDIIAGIRPEHIMLAGQQDGDVILSRLEVAEMLGNEMLLHMNTGEESLILRVPSCEDTDTSCFDARNDMTAGIVLNENKLHLFSKETRQNLLYGD